MPDVLDPAQVVMADCPAAIFGQLAAEWPDQQTAHEIVEAVHELELERASKPPIINVAVTPPGGLPVGHFRVDTGPQQKVAYVVGPPPEPGGRRVVQVTRKVREHIRKARESGPL